MFLGYAKNHGNGVYQMLNLKSNKVMLKRDISWTKKFYGSYQGKTIEEFILNMEKEGKLNKEATNSNKNDNEEIIIFNVEDEGERQLLFDNTIQEEEDEPAHKWMTRELEGLRPYNNPGCFEMEQGLFCFNMNNNLDNNEPLDFHYAWHHLDPNKRVKWKDAICLEFDQMMKNNV